MKRKLLSTVLSICYFLTAVPNLQAQIKDFKLSDYKLPDIKRQGIDLDFNLLNVSY